MNEYRERKHKVVSVIVLGVLGTLHFSAPQLGMTQENAVGSQLLNAKLQFGAKGDAQKINDGYVTNVTATTMDVNSGTANFQAGDRGKVMWCVYSAAGVVLGGIGQILSVNSPTSVTMTNSGGLNTAQYGGLQCVWGTDDTQAMVNATAAAKTASKGTETGPFDQPPQTIFVPAGGYIVGGVPFDFSTQSSVQLAASLVGEGPYSTMFFLRPDSPGPLLEAKGTGATYRDFGVDGAGNTWPAGSSLLSFSCGHCDVENLNVTRWGTYGSSAALNFNRGNVHIENLRIQGTSVGAKTLALYLTNTSTAEIYDSLFSNFYLNVLVQRAQGVEFYGGIIDECAAQDAACTSIQDSQQVSFNNTTLFGGPSPTVPVLDVDGNSSVVLNGVNVGAFGTPSHASSGLKIEQGGQASVSASVLRAVGNGWSLINNGRVCDLGGNTFMGPVIGNPVIPGPDCDTTLGAQAVAGQPAPPAVVASGSCSVISGLGDPNGVLDEPVCTIYLRKDGQPGSTLYIKESAGMTGWVAK